MRLLRSLFRWGLQLSVGCVLLEAAMPMVALAAAHGKGIAITQLCHRYGVALPGQPAHARQVPPSAVDDHHGHADEGSESSHEDHTERPGDRDECPLRGLVAHAQAPASDLAGMLLAPAGAGTASAPPAAHLAFRDAVALWARAQAHSPPRLS